MHGALAAIGSDKGPALHSSDIHSSNEKASSHGGIAQAAHTLHAKRRQRQPLQPSTLGFG
jgi:hypothetical protein